MYWGDSSTLGSRWLNWVELFDLYVTANGLTKEEQIKATFLSLIGDEAFQIHKANSKDGATLAEIKKIMEKALVTKRSEYTEICARLGER